LLGPGRGEREGGEKARGERGKRAFGCSRRWKRKEMPEEDKGKRDSREERQLGFSKDLCVISKNCKGLVVKQNFPSTQSPNEEMPKMKVGEFFKLYNIALGLKFRNSKLASLHMKF
jgi:hypothetical protein